MSANPAESLAPPVADDVLALSFLSSSPAFLLNDDAAACLHALLKHPRNSEFNGFILKTHDAQFICTQLLEAPITGAENHPGDTASVQRGVLLASKTWPNTERITASATAITR
jgi:hypothetical protein